METDTIDRECRTFCRYLIQRVPDEYIVKKYRQAHRVGTIMGSRKVTPFDSILLWVATRATVLVRGADAYSRVFHPNSLLRRKLVLLLAILECTGQTCAMVEVPDKRSLIACVASACGGAVAYALALVVSAAIFLPIQIVSDATAKIGGR